MKRKERTEHYYNVYCWPRKAMKDKERVLDYYLFKTNTHLSPFYKSEFKLKSGRVNLVSPASPIDLPFVQTIQYKLGPERLTRIGNSSVLRLPVAIVFPLNKFIFKLLKNCHNVVFQFHSFMGITTGQFIWSKLCRALRVPLLVTLLALICCFSSHQIS